MKKLSEKSKVIIFSLILILIAILGNLYFKRQKSLPQDYTIGYIYKISKSAKGGAVVMYKFHVNNNIYKGVDNLGSYRNVVGKKFVVHFPEENPDVNWIMLNYPVIETNEDLNTLWDDFPSHIQLNEKYKTRPF